MQGLVTVTAHGFVFCWLIGCKLTAHRRQAKSRTSKNDEFLMLCLHRIEQYNPVQECDLRQGTCILLVLITVMFRSSPCLKSQIMKTHSKHEINLWYLFKLWKLSFTLATVCFILRRAYVSIPLTERMPRYHISVVCLEVMMEVIPWRCARWQAIQTLRHIGRSSNYCDQGTCAPQECTSGVLRSH